MEWLDDSKACLGVTQTMLEEIEVLIQESILNDDVVPYLKVKIKNCLENCRSPLDYAANFIFHTYCKMNYSEKELKRLKVYFPIIIPKEGKDEKYEFDKSIKVNFKGLINSNPAIVEILESCQGFNTNTWLQDLTFLINENKHRNLTKQNRDIASHIRSYTDENNNSFVDIFSSNSNGIVMGGIPLDEKILKARTQGQNVDATLLINYYFKELNKLVIPTLKDIYEGTSLVIKNLESTI